MSLEISPTVVDLAAKAAAAAPTSNAPAAVVDVAHFQAAYAQSQQEAAAVGAPVVQATDSESFRAVLDALNSLNGRATQLGDLSKTATGTADLTPGDMLMLSVRCHEFMFQCELTSNVANRTSDGVQQLFRQQS
ncbi:MAG TPA: hypothetical protein PKO41_00515 [Dokdonella sp.]|uniref:hypothetical protein n=1 Tax=Dokdonella sp. TaxID=2291710 RepID=UPI0025BD38F6|nr:hypothetical protein [Dokdonella sp.]MBX3691609.1 hypothetical protein [Dokdonella sp.]MCW5567888.1 hypothetical protein [Dokdonella sp.]HNR90881.1 hypothetical protein [Dokdonella sp.]